MGRRSQLFQRRGRGRRAESRGKPKGRGQGFSASGSLWGTSRRAAGGPGGGEPGPLSRTRRESLGVARRQRRGRPALLQRGVRAGYQGRRSTGLEGLTREALKIRPGRGLGPDFFNLRGCAGSSSRRVGGGAGNLATLSPQIPRMPLGEARAQSISISLPADPGAGGAEVLRSHPMRNQRSPRPALGPTGIPLAPPGPQGCGSPRQLGQSRLWVAVP